MTATLRGADYLFDLLAAAGVREVFLLPGGGAMHLVDAVGKHPGLRHVPQHHEQACGIAAEAAGRVRGDIGVALVTTGPGATNALTPVAGAWIESTPLLVVSGQVKRADLLAGRPLRQSGVQEVDIVALARAVTKYAVTILEPTQIRYHVERALYLARHGRQGPVWLDVPLDVQGAPVDPATQVGFDPSELERESVSPPLADYVGRLRDALAAAERPLLLLGHGVRLAGAAALVGELVAALPLPVVTTWNALDLLPFEHPQVVGRPGAVALRAPNFAVQTADLVLAIGARLDHVVTAYNPRHFARSAETWVVDIDPAELARHAIPDERRVAADAREFLAALHAAVVARPLAPRSGWLERCRGWKDRYSLCDGAEFPATGPISHFRAVDALSRHLPEASLIVTGSSGLAVEAFYTGFRNRPGQRVFLTSGLGAMGYGLPAAIGACVARGGRTFLVESDGSLQLNLQELATIRALGLPVVIFLLNNRGYASIRNTQRNYFQGRYVGTGPEASLFLPDPADLARAYGIEALWVDDAAALDATLAQAVAHPGPLLCDLRLVADEVLWPRVSSQPQPDGSMVSLPLEDMTPLLPLEVLAGELGIPLLPASYLARGLPVPT